MRAHEGADMPTVARLRELFVYDPDTGLIHTRHSRGPLAAGAICGSRHSKGYLSACADHRRLFCHRIAWAIFYGEWPAGQIDHINGDKQDNRICNLRVVDNSTNHQNRKAANAGSVSGLLGAHWDIRNKKFRASIHIGKKRVHLGRFNSAMEAHQAYMRAKQEIHPGYVA